MRNSHPDPAWASTAEVEYGVDCEAGEQNPSPNVTERINLTIASCVAVNGISWWCNSG